MVLAILDGWGYSHERDHNAVRAADTPVMDALWHAYPHTLIEASGAAVGLPDHQMGNSEVGHLTIGSGRIIRQELVRIGSTRRKHDRKLVFGARLPVLLNPLRTGMGLLGMTTAEQDRNLHELAMGVGERMGNRPGTHPTDVWSTAVLLLSRREPFVDGFSLHSHRELDDQALRVLSHHDHLRLQVVCHGGDEPDADTLQRVRGLALGDRFERKRTPVSRYMVNLEWLGADGQLCLLFDEFQTGYLYHRMRLARHLQSGILTPAA
jgi:hypothetical protein